MTGSVFKYVFLGGYLSVLGLVLFSFSIGADEHADHYYSSCAIAKAGSYGEISAIVAELNDINSTDKRGQTLLHCAAFFNTNPEVTSLLLSAGADPHLEDEDDWSPLELAAYYNTHAVVKAFIDGGADPKTVDDAGYSLGLPGRRTALHYAAENNRDPKVVEELISAGANPHLRDEAHWSPLDLALRYNTPDVVRALITGGANPSATDEYGLTALHYTAIYNENPEITALLAGAGVDPRVKDREDWSPLGRAIVYNTLEVIETLIAGGADLDIKEGGGWSLMELAVAYNTPEVVGVFLSIGGDPLMTDESDRTLLHYAAKYNQRLEMIDFLVSLGLDPKATDREGRTAWDYATEYNENPEITARLAGLDPHVTDEQG